MKNRTPMTRQRSRNIKLAFVRPCFVCLFFLMPPALGDQTDTASGQTLSGMSDMDLKAIASPRSGDGDVTELLTDDKKHRKEGF